MGASEPLNLVTGLERLLKGTVWAGYLRVWEDLIFSLLIVCILSLLTYFAGRKRSLIPGRLQMAAELFVGALDDFVCGILGPEGRAHTPFIGTLFIYILFMNLFGLVPFMKSSTSSWSTTLALALCVFIYVQYTGLKKLGPGGYLYHMMGKPKGALAFSVIFPLFMFFLETISELIRPISLSLRLRSNIWGDDMLLGLFAGFGLKGVPILLFNMLLSIIASIVQAVIFALLTTIYLALVLVGEEESKEKSGNTFLS